MEDPGVPTLDGSPVETAHRRVWQRFCENFHLFRSTPTGLWLCDELVNVFGVTEKPSAESAQRIYDHLEELLARPEFSPRILFERFEVETLVHHRRRRRRPGAPPLAARRRLGRRRTPDLPPGRCDGSRHPGWGSNIERLSEASGADIPLRTAWTRGLKELLNELGSDPRFRLIVFTLDESAYSRELAPLAGHYPAMLLGAPWWFYDSPLAMRRYLDAVIETAGAHNTAVFNDDTRAFASSPARHFVWRRVTCDWLAGQLTTGVIDEEDARAMARDFAYGLAKRAYNLEGKPARSSR